MLLLRVTMWLWDCFLWVDVRRTLLYAFVLTVLLVYFLIKKDPPNFPRGPPLGNVFNIEHKQPHIYVTKLADVYGKVFCIRLGRHKTVFGSNWGMVKEALVTQADNFVDRPYSPMVDRIYSGNSGNSREPRRDVWRELVRSLEASIRAEIERHKLDLDPSNPRDYIDSFLMESQRNRNSELGFDEDNLVLCCVDLFLAGSETTSKTLQWGLIYLIKNPHIQVKVQAEIDRVIGQNRLPNLPYTDKRSVCGQ